MALAPRAVLVHRQTEYSELLARHSTVGLAEFYLRSRGRSIEDVRERHEVVQSALSAVYFGDRGHQSSRYSVTLPSGEHEKQSSSGVIVATGTGSTGWSASIASDRLVTQELPAADSDHLRWYIREAWPSPSTGRTLTEGTLAAGENLEFVVASDNLVLFGDGMESDHLTVGWGQRVVVRSSSRVLYLA